VRHYGAVVVGACCLVNSVALTPEGHRAVSASADWTLRVWDVESEKTITSFTGDSRMLSCAVAPNCHTVVAGDMQGQVHFLRLVEADETKPTTGETKIPLLQRKEPGTDP
jgi:WD40 repeat protein